MIGTAFALNILFDIPVWAGVLLTGFSTLLLLGLQRYGVSDFVSDSAQKVSIVSPIKYRPHFLEFFAVDILYVL